MLFSFLSTKEKDERDDKHRRRIRCAAWLPCCCCCILLGCIVVVVTVSLIPLYLEDHAVATSAQVECAKQTLLFEIPDNSSIEDGVLNSTGVAQLQQILQDSLRSNPIEAISTSRVVLQQAEVSTVNNANRRRRDVSEMKLVQVTNNEISTGVKLLSATLNMYFLAKYGYYCHTKYKQIVQSSFSSVTVPNSLLLMTDSNVCEDTTGYSEPGTGYTCETYSDYGFCDGSGVTTGAAINTTLAEENCCACGKGTINANG